MQQRLSDIYLHQNDPMRCNADLVVSYMSADIGGGVVLMLIGGLSDCMAGAASFRVLKYSVGDSHRLSVMHMACIFWIMNINIRDQSPLLKSWIDGSSANDIDLKFKLMGKCSINSA